MVTSRQRLRRWRLTYLGHLSKQNHHRLVWIVDQAEIQCRPRLGCLIEMGNEGSVAFPG